MHPKRTRRNLKLRLLAILLCLPMPLFVAAQSEEGDDAETGEPQELQARRPFLIKTTSQFACAEVAEDRTGGLASHDITLGPQRIERCLLQKVGTRLHECEKFKVGKATVDLLGIIRVETETGEVEMWFDKGASISSTKDSRIAATVEGKGSLIFTFPDNEMKYICAPFR